MERQRAVHWPSVVRGVVLFVYAAVLLHLLGAKVGSWANGSFGPALTLLVGIVAPAWFFVCLPTWFAWRIAKPLGLRRLAWVACWFSPLVGRHDLASLRVFLAVEAEQGFPAEGTVSADAWTALAAAVEAEQQGNTLRARAIADALHCLPEESRFPWLARCHGVESLVLLAWQRADWNTVLDYAAFGRGRVVRLFTLLARVAVGQPILPRTLWWAWLLSPVRRRTFEFVRAATAAGRFAPKVTPAPTGLEAVVDACLDVDVRSRHVAILEAASKGGVVTAGEVSALLRAWQPHLDKAGLARLSARALELDVRDSFDEVQAVRAGVLSEIVALAACCESKLAAGGDDLGLAGEVTLALREQLCREVEVALEGIGPESFLPGIRPLEAWERWLALRRALDRLAIQDEGAFFALWNGRVAATVWNWTCVVFNCHGGRASWIAHMMYVWIAEQAERMGDMRTVVVNRENARIALGA
jgi:hypothetical protein